MNHRAAMSSGRQHVVCPAAVLHMHHLLALLDSCTSFGCCQSLLAAAAGTTRSELDTESLSSQHLFPKTQTRGKSSSLLLSFCSEVTCTQVPGEEKRTWRNLWGFDSFLFFSFLWVTSESPPTTSRGTEDSFTFKELKARALKPRWCCGCDSDSFRVLSNNER